MFIFCICGIILLTICGAVNVDDQTVIRIDGVNKKGLILNLQNGSLPITGSVVTHWSPWGKCHRCRQERVKQLITYNNGTSTIIAEDSEERPCRTSVCLRLWHKKRSKRRMHVVKMQPETKQLQVFGHNKHRKIRIWSKWSTWSKCSRNCHTERYKVCKKPGRCKKLKKYEFAWCYYPNSTCETMVRLTTLHWVRPTATTTTQAPFRHYTQHGGVIQHDDDGGSRAYAAKHKQQCGRPLRKHALLKIKGGRNAKRGMWPWHVAVVNQHQETFCSGTLIAPRWVLTAAHCIRTKMKVRINEFDLWLSDGEIEISVERAMRHYMFNLQNIDNDIGLLYLARAVKTPVACLPNLQPEGSQVAQKCTVLGWGAQDASSESGYHILQEAKIPIVKWDQCKSAYPDYFISHNMFCAGYPTGKIDTCRGDSGGGLLCRSYRTDASGKRKAEGYVVQGITSFGDACGKANRYGIYANVTNYLKWIHHTIVHVERGRSERRHYRPDHLDFMDSAPNWL